MASILNLLRNYIPSMEMMLSYVATKQSVQVVVVKNFIMGLLKKGKELCFSSYG